LDVVVVVVVVVVVIVVVPGTIKIMDIRGFKNFYCCKSYAD